MTRFKLVKVPIEATDFFINNVGCLRYSHNEGKESTAIDPMEMEIYLEKHKHIIVGETFLKEQRYVVIEMAEW